MVVFIGALLMVVLAEMGDKTQLLAMAFATRFPARMVLWGVLIATILNHALAVAVGSYISLSSDMQLIQIIASASFIFFGLWTIYGDQLDGEDKKPVFINPIVTVAIAFFIAEMGDKTQLATVALAAKYQSPLFTLAGTTAGMMIADALGIYVGVVAGKKIPEKTIKWVSALLFIGFGYIGLYASAPAKYITLPWVGTLILLTIAAIVLIVNKNKSSSGKNSSQKYNNP